MILLLRSINPFYNSIRPIRFQTNLISKNKIAEEKPKKPQRGNIIIEKNIAHKTSPRGAIS